MIVVNEDNFENVILKSKLPVLLDVYADWCNPCRAVAPIVEQVARELEGQAIVGKIDSDANHDLIAKLGIGALPTLLVFNQGEEVHRMVGLQSREKLLATIQATNFSG